MARVPLLADRDQLAPEAQRIYDQIAARRGNVPGPYQVLLHVPELAGRVGMLGQYLRFEGSLPAAVRETAILAAARETNCAYEWSQHEPLARAAGVPDHVITAIAERRGLDGLPPQQTIPIALARECVQRHRVPDDLFAAARGAWGTPGVVELVIIVGYYAMLAILLNATDVQPAPGTPRLPPT
jgi:4-carboxymuconolactone decarboxylase